VSCTAIWCSDGRDRAGRNKDRHRDARVVLLRIPWNDIQILQILVILFASVKGLLAREIMMRSGSAFRVEAGVGARPVMLPRHPREAND
jgi:hypothetical protein